MGIEVRLLQESEKDLANTFFNSIYKSRRTIEDFTWEFHKAPAGKAIYVVALDNAHTPPKIVGIQGAIPIEFISSQGKVILTAKSEDTLVDPSYRGQKIFEKMYEVLFSECQKAGIKYIWGFTPAEKAFLRIGFEIPFKAKQALAVLNPTKAYSYLSRLNLQNKPIDKIKIRALCLLSWFKIQALLFRRNDGYLVKESGMNDLNEYFQEFYGSKSLYNISLDPRFIKWRIEDNPNKNRYKHFLVKHEARVVASVIVNFRAEVSYVEQILTSNDAHIEPVVKSIGKEMKKERPALIRLLCFENNDFVKSQYKKLSEAGLITLDRGNSFVWKSFVEEGINPNSMFVTRLFTQGNL